MISSLPNHDHNPQNHHAIRYGGCWHNADPKNFEPPSRELWYWHDSEGNRDATKTNIISHYKFAEALENTKSRDYFTEKRYQAFFARTLPIIFGNDNSAAFTPHPSSAIFVEDHGRDLTQQARGLAEHLRYLDGNDTAYLEYFQWKRAGPSREFVKHLFKSRNYQLCRICEHISTLEAAREREVEPSRDDEAVDRAHMRA